MIDKTIIPPKLAKVLSKYQLIETLPGRLGDEIIKFSNNHQTVFFKSGTGVSAKSLKQEMKALEWLENKKLIVPKIIDFSEFENKAFLLITGVDGTPAHKLKNQMEKQDILKIVAQALSDFHRIPTDGVDSLNSLDKDLQKIGDHISMGVINEEAFIAANNGKSPQEVLSFLSSKRDSFQNNTLTHGDYCLPNILINNGNYGFIDLGDCGAGDAYKDFSAMEVSIKRNFGTEWIDTFYKYYDHELTINEDKIKYYQLIDQFGYHLDIGKYNNLSNC